MSETVSLDYEIKSPIARVWRALTDPATLSRWTLFDVEDFQPAVGNRFQFRGKEATGWTGIVDGEVLEADEPNRLSYTWTTEGQMGRHRTTVTWTLKESGNGVTQLHLEQSGFDREAKQEVGGAKYGWTHQLHQLSDLLAHEDHSAEG